MKEAQENKTKKELQKTLAQMRQRAEQNHTPILREKTQEKLIELVRQIKPQKVLEIGTAIGYSALLFLSNSGAHVYSVDINEQSQAQAKEVINRLGYGGRATFLLGDAAEIIPKSLGKYDTVFLDGAKSQYYLLLPYLIDMLTVGGALIADNVLYMGLTRQAHLLPNSHKHITIARNLAAFLKALEEDERLQTRIYDIEEGLSCSIKIKD